jgi:transketolase
LTVLTPSDAKSTYALVLALAAFPSACYVRTVRGDLPILYDEAEQFPLVGHKVLRRAVTPEDVLAYVHLSVEEIIAAAVKAAR